MEETPKSEPQLNLDPSVIIFSSSLPFKKTTLKTVEILSTHQYISSFPA